MTFRVGQRVVFVGPDFSVYGGAVGQIVPEYGKIYTIRSISPVYGESAFLLREIRNEPRCWACGGTFELHMNAKFFRPVVERKTDISIFTKMLTPSRVDA